MIVFTRHLCDGCGLEFDVGEGETAYVVHPNVPAGAIGWAMRLALGDSLATFCEAACYQRLVDAAANTDLLEPIRYAIGEAMRSVGMTARKLSAAKAWDERCQAHLNAPPAELVQIVPDLPLRPLGDDEPQRPNQPAPADL